MLPLLLARSSPSIQSPPLQLSTPPPPCQLRGVPAKWVLPLEKSLSNWLAPRTAALEQDMLFGHYVSKHYHQGNRMEVSAPDDH